VTGSRFSISELVLPGFKENGAHENSAWIMSLFSVTCVNGSDIMKIFGLFRGSSTSGRLCLALVC
jgi:hypothetical protein